ncbi:MAG TPA: hypothetical protein VI160_01410, partial [Gemmatimonadales bacterium]
YADYDDGLIHDATLLYLIARHFPGRIDAIRSSAIDAIVAPLAQGSYNSLSSAYTILALDAYVTAAGPVAAGHYTISEALKNGTRQLLSLPAGTFPEADVSPNARAVEFASDAPVNAFYLLSQSGFDRTIPARPFSSGIEVFRDYTDKNGKPVTSVTLGDEIQVHLRFRALGNDPIQDVALVDLLPGGFEVVENPVTPAAARAGVLAPRIGGAPDTASANEEGDGEGDEEGATSDTAWVPTFGQGTGAWTPEYAEEREDRVNVYGFADKDAHEFVYTIKATAVGSFAVAPAYAEGMYDRSVKAWSQPGRIVVKRP